MSKTQLPELPEPAIIGDDVFDSYLDPDAQFTGDQMHAYGLAVWNAAIEATAKECERHALKWDGPFSRAAADCANAIRSMPEPAVTQQERTGE